jgi:copper transport protein
MNAAIPVAVLLILVTSRQAHAHALLLHTEPASNQRLEKAPEQVVLIFNERVEPEFNAVRVQDLNGNRVDQGDLKVVDGDTLMVSVRGADGGSYGVFWRVNSLDGHQVQGQFGFGVRAAAPTEQELSQRFPLSDQPVASWFFPMTRGIGLAAVSLWLGGMGFLAFVLGGSAISRPEEQHYLAMVRKQSSRLMVVAGAAFCISELIWLWGKTATLTYQPLIQSLSWSAIRVVLTGSSLGEWWLGRLTVALVLLVISAQLLRMDPCGSSVGTGKVLAFALLGSVLLATIAATGHARALNEGVLLAQAVDWLHLAATALWLGGLVHLLFALNLARSTGPAADGVTSRITPRFSRLAQACVVVLIATGVYNSWLHLSAWASFLNSSYGRTLTLKLFLVAAILVIGFINWKRAVPAIRSLSHAPDNALQWLSKLRRLVRAEVWLGVAILGTVAVLTNLPPATTVAVGGVPNLEKRVGNYSVVLKLEPNRVGQNQATAEVRDNAGHVVPNARRVTFYLRSLDMDMGLETVQAQRTDAGMYRAPVSLSMAGRWQVSVEVSPPEGDTFLAEFNIPLTSQ